MSRTLEECLSLPGSSFPVGLDPSPSTSPPSLGVRLLEQARARNNGHTLPSQLIVAPGLVSGLYDEVKGQLPVDFQQPASVSLNAAVVTKNHYPSRTDEHEDENSVVRMDEMDIVNVALEGAACVNTALGGSRNLRVKSRSAGDKADLSITTTDPRTRESTSLLVFEHKSLSVGRHLEDFRLAEQLTQQLAREHEALDYRPSSSSRRRSPARRIISLFGGTQLSPKELKMKTILEKTILYLIRDQCRFAVISDHEHWLFLEVIDCDAVAVSPVYPAATTGPTLTQAVFAIMCSGLGHAAITATTVRLTSALSAAVGSARPGGTVSGLPATGEQPVAEPGEEAEFDWLDLFDTARPPDAVVVVADSLQDPAWTQPPKQLACTAVTSVLLLLPHVPSSQILQPSPVSSRSPESRSTDVSERSKL